MVRNLHAPGSIKEALDLKKKTRNAIFLAGGTLINRAHRRGDISLISLHQIPSLKDLERRDDCILIGSMISFTDLFQSPLLQDCRLEELQQSSRAISRNIRNMATLGGCIAYNYSNSDVIPTLVVADAVILLVDDNGADESIPIEEYIVKRSSGFSHLITGVRVPLPGKTHSILGRRFARTSMDFPTIKIAVNAEHKGSFLRSIKIALGGVADHVVRLAKVEEALREHDLRKYALELKGRVTDILDVTIKPKSDSRGSSGYKRTIAGALLEDVLAEVTKK